MSNYLSSRLRTAAMLVAVILLLALVAYNAQANVRLEGGGDVPFYARLAGDSFVHDGEWVAVFFYRPPGCVRPNFNLLSFFDAPAAFGCTPYTTDGFSIWKNGPEVDFAPIKTRLHGLGAVPVWFVSVADMEAGIADNLLTIDELGDMDSLMKGFAGFYSEELHPSEATINSMIQLTAGGQLDDGRSFFVNSTATSASGHFVTTIRFH